MRNIGIRVPGARRAMLTPQTPAYDKKGRPLWDMPRPAYKVVHVHSLRINKQTRQPLRVEVPVYRGATAEEARRIRARYRRSERQKTPSGGMYDLTGIPVGGYMYPPHRAERNRLLAENRQRRDDDARA